MIGDLVSAALPQLRAEANSTLTEPVTVTRPGGWTTAPDGREVPAAPVVFTGLAALGPVNSQTQPDDVAGQTVTAQRQVVKFPVGAFVPLDGDVVEFLAGASAHLVGVKMRLSGALPTTSTPVLYRAPAERIV